MKTMLFTDKFSDYIYVVLFEIGILITLSYLFVA